jgi:hypothetical protein
VQLLLTFPTGRLDGRWDRLLTIAAWLAAGALQPIRLLFAGQDSLDRLGCEGACPTPLTVIADRPAIADAVGYAQDVLGLLTALGVLVVVCMTWRRGSLIVRRRLAPVLSVGIAIPALLVGTVLVGVVGLAAPFMYASFVEGARCGRTSTSGVPASSSTLSHSRRNTRRPGSRAT